MARKRRSKQFKRSSRVIDMEKTEREEAPEASEDLPLPQETDDTDSGETEPIEP